MTSRILQRKKVRERGYKGDCHKLVSPPSRVLLEEVRPESSCGMHSVARRALLWSHANGRACRCFASASSSSSPGSVKDVGKSKPSGDVSCETPLDAALSDKFGADSIRKPPLQSLHKAILAGEVSLPPSQKVRKNGKVITTFNVATGGMWRLPIPSKEILSEDECTDPCMQYHKVAIHDAGLGKLAVQTLKRGMQVYVEGELETRVFNDMDTGVIKRDREIAVHASGQIMAWTKRGPVSIEYQ
eukprot:c19176_g1_i1 orf=124-855(+)